MFLCPLSVKIEHYMQPNDNISKLITYIKFSFVKYNVHFVSLV